jgi:hypothetical protein
MYPNNQLDNKVIFIILCITLGVKKKSLDYSIS